MDKPELRPDWLREFLEACSSEPTELSAEQMAKRISSALEIAEIRQYATPDSCFTFELSGATEKDISVIREHLTPFENSIVKIITR